MGFKHLISAAGVLAISCNAFSAGQGIADPVKAGSIDVDVSTAVSDTPPQIDFEGLKQYDNLLSKAVRGLSPEQIGEIPPDQFADIPPSTIALLSESQISGVTPEQTLKMTGEQISQLNSAQLNQLRNKLSEDQFDVLFSQVSKQQMVDYIVSLPPKDLKSLSDRQLKKLDPSVFQKISNQQFLAFDAGQLSSFTTGQVNSFNDNQLYWSYNKILNKKDRYSFISILNKENIAAIIKFLPRSSYPDIFNNANTLAIAGLMDSISDADRQFVLSRLSPLTVLRISEILSESDIKNLRPDQTIFLNRRDKNGK